MTLLESKNKVQFEKFARDIHRVKTLYSSYDIRFALFIFDIEQDSKQIDNEKISFLYDDEEGLPWADQLNKSVCSEDEFLALKFHI